MNVIYEYVLPTLLLLFLMGFLIFNFLIFKAKDLFFNCSVMTKTWGTVRKLIKKEFTPKTH